MDRGGWQVTVHGVTELDTTEAADALCLRFFLGFPSRLDFCSWDLKKWVSSEPFQSDSAQVPTAHRPWFLQLC